MAGFLLADDARDLVTRRLEDFGRQLFPLGGGSAQAPQDDDVVGRLTQGGLRLIEQLQPIAPPQLQAITRAPQAVQSVQQGAQAVQRLTQPEPATPAQAEVSGPAAQRGGDLRAYARQAAQRAGIDPDIFERQIQQESGFQTRATSSAGAQGIAQIVPKYHPGVDTSDPYASLDYASNLMKSHLGKYGGDYARALAAYNAGPGAVDRYGGIPPFEETQRYVSTILGGAKRQVEQAVKPFIEGARVVGAALQPGEEPPTQPKPQPTSDKWRTSFDFGSTYTGAYRTGTPHRGIDLVPHKGGIGTAVEAFHPGTVSLIQRDNGAGGLMVYVRDEQGLTHAYMHLQGTAPGLQVGQRVERGQQIATMGESGTEGSPHLHYEVRRNAASGDPLNQLIDPRPYMTGQHGPESVATAARPTGLTMGVMQPGPTDTKTITRPLEDLGRGAEQLGQGGLQIIDMARQQFTSPQTQGMVQRALPGGVAPQPGVVGQAAGEQAGRVRALYEELTGPGSERFPTGGPIAGYVVGAERFNAADEQLLREAGIDPEQIYAARQRASRAYLATGQPGQLTAAERVLEQRANDIIRAAGGMDVRAMVPGLGGTNQALLAAQRAPDIREREERARNAQTIAAVAALPVAGLAGVPAAASAAIQAGIDPGNIPFLPLEAPALVAAARGRMPGGVARFLADEAGELRIPGGFRAPEPGVPAPLRPSTRIYHGAGQAFQTPDPRLFDPDALYGPAYYGSTDPRLPGGIVSEGMTLPASVRSGLVTASPSALRETIDASRRYIDQLAASPQTLDRDVKLMNLRQRLAGLEHDYERMLEAQTPGTVIRPGYAQERAVQEGLAPETLADLQRRADHARTTLAQNPEANLRTYVENELADVEARLATHTRGMGANVRAVDVPQDLNLLDMEAPVPEAQAKAIGRALWGLDAPVDEIESWSTSAVDGNAVYDLIIGEVGSKAEANRLLAGAGIDGVTYSGGKRVPMMDAAGMPIEHTAYAIFPESLPKIRNAISGRQGGFAQARFAGQLAGAAGGAATGYATTPEEAGPGERLLRTGAGAVAGVVGTSAALGVPGAMDVGRGVTDIRSAARAVAATQSNLPGMAAAPPRAAERVLAYLVNNALSNTASFFTNASGLLENARRPIVSVATAGVELATGNVRGARREMAAAGADVAAMGAALSDGLAAMGQTFVTGVRPSRVITGDIQREAFEGPLGMVATPFLRGLAAVDEMNATLSNAGGQGAEIARLMVEHPNLSMQEVIARFQPRIMAEGTRSTEEALYISGGSGIGRWWSGQTQALIGDPSRWKQAGGIGMNILVPFAKIPDVLLTRGLMRLPVINEVRATIQATRAAKAGRPTEAKRIVAEAALTSMINTAVAYQVVQGNITGNGPSDPMRKRALMAARDENGNAVWAPNSIRVGDRWISYSSWGPLAVQFGGIANGIEAMRDESRELTPDYIGAAFLATGETVADAWYLQSMARIFSGIRTGQWAETAGETITDYVSRIVPEGALANQIRNSTDPNIREPANLLQRFQNRLPGVAGGAGPIPPVPERIDLATGRAFQRPTDWSSFIVRGTAPGEPDRINQVLAEHNLPSPQLPDTLSMGPQRFPLEQAEKEAYARAIGPELSKRVLKFADSPSFQKQDPLEQQEQLRRQIGFAREIAERRVWATISSADRKRRAAEYQASLQRQGLPQTFDQETAEEFDEGIRTSLSSGLSAAEQRARQLVGAGSP